MSLVKGSGGIRVSGGGSIKENGIRVTIIALDGQPYTGKLSSGTCEQCSQPVFPMETGEAYVTPDSPDIFVALVPMQCPDCGRELRYMRVTTAQLIENGYAVKGGTVEYRN
jgi:hypothetical protein